MLGSFSSALFPLFLELRGGRVLVVGSGGAAARKVNALLEAPALLIVGAVAAYANALHWFGDAAITSTHERCRHHDFAQAA